MSASKRNRVIYEDKHLRITKLGSGGREHPRGFKIEMFNQKIYKTKSRVLYISVDELFDLTEQLDDLCDAIEDAENPPEVST